MRRREHQSGFGTVEILLVVLVVVALAVVGLVVYQHHKPSSTKGNAATSSSQPTGQQQSTTGTQTQPATYLTITEWGVKIPLSSSINDAYYVPSVGSSTGADKQPNTMLVGLKSLDSSNCAATNTSAIALIFRALPTDTDSATGKLYTKEYPDGVTVGNYFYAYQNLNSTTCKASPTTIQSTNSAFVSAVKGMVSATAATN